MREHLSDLPVNKGGSPQLSYTSPVTVVGKGVLAPMVSQATETTFYAEPCFASGLSTVSADAVVTQGSYPTAEVVSFCFVFFLIVGDFLGMVYSSLFLFCCLHLLFRILQIFAEYSSVFFR